MTGKRLGYLIKKPHNVGKGAGPSPRLNTDEELTIVEWITNKANAHMHTTMNDIITFGNDILKLRSIYGYGISTKRAVLGKDWYYGFLSRHSNKLGKRKLQGLELSRVKRRDTIRMLEFYIRFRDLKEKYKFKDDRIFNCDETPCAIDDIPRYGIWPKSLKDAHIVNTSNRQVLTMFSCVAASGFKIPPLIIFEEKTIDLGFVNYDFEFLASTNSSAWLKLCLDHGVNTLWNISTRQLTVPHFL